MRKILLYIRINILYQFQNKARAVLTISGICIGLVIFIIGNAFIQGYISGYYQRAIQFDKNSFLVQTDNISQLEQLCPELTQERRTTFYFLRDQGQANQNYMYKGREVQNVATLVGVRKSVCNHAVAYSQGNNLGAGKSKILYGRDINAGDIGSRNPVAVIEKSVAILLFHIENAVGKTIEYYDPSGLKELEVIGIIDDLPGIKDQIYNFNKSLRQDDGTRIFLEFQCYVPYTILEANPAGIREVYLYHVPDQELADVNNTIDYFMASIQGSGKPARVDSRYRLLQLARQEESAAQTTLSVFLLLIILVSGFVIMTILTFSIKERVSEIGIRRALGASAFDIAIQFITEGIILSIISALISLFISIHTCNIITALLAQNFIRIPLIVNVRTVIATLCIALIQGIIFTSIPALIAAKVRPTEAIRWD